MRNWIERVIRRFKTTPPSYDQLADRFVNAIPCALRGRLEQQGPPKLMG
jgi:hypothetical protein